MSRKLKRKMQKNEGTLTHKKVLAKKLGCSVAELDERLARREKNLKEMEGVENGKQ